MRVPIVAPSIAIAAKYVASSTATAWSWMSQASTERCSAKSTIEVDAFSPFKVRAVHIIYIFDAKCDCSGGTAGSTHQNNEKQYD